MWLYVPAVKQGRTKKLSSLWRGPYTILDKTSPVNYRIQLIGSTVSLTVHQNCLKPCYGNPNQMAPRATKSGSQGCTKATSIQNHPSSAPRSYHDALLEPVAAAGYTSSDSIATPDNSPVSSRPVQNRQPPERYGNSDWH